MLKQMKIWQKLVLMGVIFLIPLLIVTYAMVSSMRTLGIVFAEKEVMGTDYEAPQRKLLQQLQQHRTLAAAVLSGQTAFQGKIEALSPAIESSLAAIGAVDARYGSVLRATDKLAGVREQVRSLMTSWKSLSAAESFARHTDVITALLGFISHVGDTSNLVFDPDQDTYYLMDATTFAIPELSETMSQAGAMAMALASRGTGEADRQQLMGKMALMTYYAERLRGGYAKVSAYNNAAGGKLDKDLATAVQAIERWQTTLQNHFVGAGAGPIGADALWSAADGSLGSAYGLFDVTLPVLTELIETRIGKLSWEMYRTILLVLLGAILVSVVGYFIIRDINRPLRGLVQTAQRIAAGDLSAAVDTEARGDEIGTLTTAFGQMVDSLRDQLRSLTEGVNTLGASTSQILIALTQVVAGASETATAVNEAATTVEEVKQTAQIANQRANEVAGSAQQAVAVSHTGERSVEDAVDGMTKVRAQMESIAESVVRLGEQSRAIGEIIAAVNDLAEQSNLLAVNAGIEAAKAGEQGRGFAVVAQEVKSLAEQSKQATAQVRQLLNDIQKASNVAVMVTEQGTKSAEIGVKQSIDAGESIRALAKSISDAAQSVSQITASSQQQLVGMDQVAAAMQHIREASTQNVDSMKQIESSVQTLSEVSATLQELVAKYTLSDDGTLRAAA